MRSSGGPGDVRASRGGFEERKIRTRFSNGTDIRWALINFLRYSSDAFGSRSVMSSFWSSFDMPMRS